MVFLQSHCVSATYAVKIYKQYQDKAIEGFRSSGY
ncbi:hypothetical protein LC612_39280 [Nostoc sp. CHAB 5834]|nr:hypothetical protein [Nostoc sp. CHAB 5834]